MANKFIEKISNNRWGWFVTLLFIAFASMIATLVYKANNTHFDLVSEDYYKNELVYQDIIDAKNRTAKLSPISVTLNKHSVIFLLPQEQRGLAVNGSLRFYCPTNKMQDKQFPLYSNEQGQTIIPIATLSKGVYQLQAEWRLGDSLFYADTKVQVL